jgi:dimethylamine/trimethylamine dehydrogenase
LRETAITKLVSPEHVLDGGQVSGKVVIYGDDHYYMGSVLAEELRDKGADVTLVTPAPMVAEWSTLTMEQHRIQKRLLEKGVTVICAHSLQSVGDGAVTLTCVYTGKETVVAADVVIPVTTRIPQRALFDAVMKKQQEFDDLGLKSATRIGDCLAPGIIAMAVYGGHQYAREFEAGPHGDVPFLRENYQP